jgi:hypothetical protein
MRPIRPTMLREPRRATRKTSDVRTAAAVTDIQPQLWVERPSEAVTFYEAAFGATVMHRVGDRSLATDLSGLHRSGSRSRPIPYEHAACHVDEFGDHG